MSVHNDDDLRVHQLTPDEIDVLQNDPRLAAVTTADQKIFRAMVEHASREGLLPHSADALGHRCLYPNWQISDTFKNAEALGLIQVDLNQVIGTQWNHWKPKPVATSRIIAIRNFASWLPKRLRIEKAEPSPTEAPTDAAVA